MSNEHTSSNSKGSTKELRDEMKESFEGYLKSIEPYILLYFCFFVIPDMLARFERSDESVDENTGQN